MHTAGDKKREARRRRYGRFTPRSSLNNLLPRANQTTKALPTEREDEVTRELAKFRKYPLEYSEKHPVDLVVFRDGTTPRDEGERWIPHYVTSCIDVMLYEYDHDSTQATLDKIYAYLGNDPVGIEKIPYSDTTVWKKNDNVNSDDSGDENDNLTESDRFAPTEFGDNLFVYHRMMYKILRASLPLYLDKVANERLSLWIIGKEFHLKDEDKPRRLDKGIRIPWDDIKEFVLSSICLVTLGSYKYLPLHQLKRKDGMLFSSWMSTVKEIVIDVKNHGGGWENIIDPEALQVLYKWLSEPEKNQLNQFLVNRGLQFELPDLAYMIRKVDFNKFVSTFIDVKREQLPQRFTQSKAKEALASTLLTHAEAEEMTKQKTAKLQREITSLKAEIVNLKSNNKRKKPETRGQDRNPKRGKGPKANDKDDKDYVPTIDEHPNVPIGKYGQCKQGCCQRCHNLGMKNRRHKGPCDPEARRKAAEKKKKKKERKQDNRDDNNRKHHYSLYPDKACTHCIREDVDPKYSDHHTEDQCYRRPGGYLDQNKIKGKEARNKEVIRLVKQKQAENAQKHGKPAATTRSTKKVEFVATCRSAEQVTEAGSGITITRPSAPTPNKTKNPEDSEEEDINLPKGVSEDDPRLSKYQSHMKPRRYLRNATAIKHPMSIQEIDLVLSSDGEVRSNFTQQLVRMKHEFLSHENKLIELRQHMRPEHPRIEDIRDAPADEGEPYVHQVGGEYIPLTGNPELMGETQNLEIVAYKKHYDPTSDYMKMVCTLTPQLSRLMGYTNEMEAQAMADSLHARYSRNHNCEGPWYDLIRNLCQKSKWPGHAHTDVDALKHMPFPLHFPNLRSIKSLDHASLIYTAVMAFMKNHVQYMGDVYDISQYLEKLEKVRNLMREKVDAKHLHQIKLQNAQKAKEQRQIERDARLATKERNQRLEDAERHKTRVEYLYKETRQLKEKIKDLQNSNKRLLIEQQHADDKVKTAERKAEQRVKTARREGNRRYIHLKRKLQQEQSLNAKRDRSGGSEETESGKNKNKKTRSGKNKGKSSKNKGKRRRKRKPRKRTHLNTNQSDPMSEGPEEIPKVYKPSQPGYYGKSMEDPRGTCSTPLRVETDTEPTRSPSCSCHERHARPLRARRVRRTRTTYYSTSGPSKPATIHSLIGSNSDDPSEGEKSDVYTVSDDSDSEVSAERNSTSQRAQNTHLSPETVAEQRYQRQRPAPLKKDKAYYDLFTGVLDLPSEAWCPCTTQRDPVARTYASIIKQQDMQSNESILPSEKLGQRLLQAYVSYRDKNGNVKRGRVQLDTYSNVNYVSAEVGLKRPLRHPWEATKVRGITNKTIRLGKPRTFTLMKNGDPVSIDCNTAPHNVLKGDCVALLGLDAITMLGIDVNHAVENERHVDVRYKIATHELCDRAKRAAIDRYDKRKPLERYLYATCCLSERICAEYVKQHPNDYLSKAIEAESIDICPSVPHEYKSRILSFLMKYTDVFAQSTNTLPRELKRTGKHKFKLKENATPVRSGRPRFGKAQAKIINDWVDWALEVGLIEKATTTSWASRLILAPKYNHDTPKSSLPDGIRIAWAGVEVNERIEKTVPTYPDAWEQLYKVANYKYKFSADGLKQYWSIGLEKSSREVTAFWTPRGLYQFTRLVMGTKNAATVAQNAYTHALNALLARESADHIANFADDFLGGADTYESLVTHFEEFIKMCRAAGITLNPKKIRIGYEQEQFYGLKITRGKIEPADRNLDPVRRVTTPKTRSDLRSIMGIFNQFSSFIKDYGRTSGAGVLNSLMSPKVPFVFTTTHQAALDSLKDQILKGVHLYAPDNDYPLILETDGSADGWGAVLYQKINGEKRIVKMWSKQWKTEAWSKKPAYHREAKAWMNGLTNTIPYALQNKFPVQCWTDHTPLTWIKQTSGKGPVSQFIVDTLSVIDYEMNYIKGEDNTTADTLSRFPLLGPAKLHQHGIRKAVNILLSALVCSDANPRKVWFDTGKDTQHFVPDLYDWRDEILKTQPALSGRRHCFMDTLSVANIRRINYTLGIWAPPADKVTQQCREAFEKGTPFACLVPNDLVHHICKGPTGETSPEVQAMVEEAFKITLLAPGLTWIVHGLTIDRSQEPLIRTVFAGEAERDVEGTDRVTEEYELQELVKHLKNSNLTPPLPEFSTRERWIEEQRKHRTKLLYKDMEGVYEAQDGLLVYEERPGAPLRTIVPDSMTIPLVEWQHQNLCHVGPQKILNTLKARFYWKGMRRVCEYVNDMCALCNLLKARMRLAHKHFRPKLHCKPRTSYGADYYAVVQNKEGYNNILGIIDLANAFLVLSAVKKRSGANTAHVVFYEIVVRKGVPQLFHSDAAKEFIGTAMKALSTILGFKMTNTLAHNPKGNAKIERVWLFVGRCLQSMSPEQYQNFHRYLPIIAHVWNTTPDTNTGITPFKAQYGMDCASVAESILQETPKEGLPASADDLRTIATSVTAFNECIANVKAVEKAQAAIRLNANGTSKITYNIGDQVSFYLPPDDTTVKKMGKKRKHILQYCGPAEIVEVLSPNNTAFKIRYKGRFYKRNVMHINKYKAHDEVPAELQMVVDHTISVGSYVAVLDDDEDHHYHIAQVLDINDRETQLHYLGTKSRSIRSACWTKLYLEPGTNHVTQQRPGNLARRWTRFTGSIDTKEPGDSLIIMANVGFTDTMRINAESRRILSRKRVTHHVMGHTWNP